MGMYTEFHFNAEIRKDIPENIMNILEYMMRDGDIEEPKELPDHPFFTCERWRGLCTGDSAYFSMTNNRCIDKDFFSSIVINIRSNIKNYSGEIEKFLHWISPYTDECLDTFLGYFRYEEDILPQLIFVDSDKHKIVIKRIETLLDAKWDWYF